MNSGVDYMDVVFRFRRFQVMASPLAEGCRSLLETHAICSKVPDLNMNVLYSRLCSLSAEGLCLRVDFSRAYSDALAQLEASGNEAIRFIYESRLETIRRRLRMIDEIETFRVCIGRIGGIVMH